MNENENRARAILQKKVRNNLKNVKSGDEIQILIATLLADCRVMWSNHDQVKRDLSTMLSPFFPYVKIEVFGSTLMDIAMKGIAFERGGNHFTIVGTC